MSEVTHIENGRKAFTKLFRQGGSLQAEGMYMTSRKLNEQGEPMRLKQGEWVYYDANGQVRLKESYNMDVLHGPAVTLSKNGKRLEEGSYVDGERDGTWKTWDELGTVLSEIGYRDGVFHGMCKINYANGRPQTVGMYDTGKENGYWKSFMEDGTVQTTRQFDHGELLKEIHENGAVLLTFSDGRPREEFEVVNQLKSGPFREWHDTGEWTIEESIDPETGDPIRKRILTGEAIRREGEYVNGKLDGDVYNYDLNGRLLLIERLKMGRLKAAKNNECIPSASRIACCCVVSRVSTSCAGQTAPNRYWVQFEGKLAEELPVAHSTPYTVDTRRVFEPQGHLPTGIAKH